MRRTERKDCGANLSLFPCSVCEIDHSERLQRSPVSLSPEKARTEALNVASSALFSTLSIYTSHPGRRTHTHRWPFLAGGLRNEIVGDIYRSTHAEAVCCLVELKREYRTVKINWTRVVLPRWVQMWTAICLDEKQNMIMCIRHVDHDDSRAGIRNRIT